MSVQTLPIPFIQWWPWVCLKSILFNCWCSEMDFFSNCFSLKTLWWTDIWENHLLNAHISAKLIVRKLEISIVAFVFFYIFTQNTLPSFDWNNSYTHTRHTIIYSLVQWLYNLHTVKSMSSKYHILYSIYVYLYGYRIVSSMTVGEALFCYKLLYTKNICSKSNLAFRWS